MDDNTIHKYLVSNYMPLMIGVIRKMKNKGLIPQDMSHLSPDELFLDLYEPAVHGLMKSIHTYDPNKLSLKTGNKKSFIAHAWSTISGIVSDHLKNKNIASADVNLARINQAKKENASTQTIGIKGQGIGREVAEHLGGTVGEEGEGVGGVSVIRNPEQEFATRLSPEAKNILQAKIDKAKAKLGEKTQTSSDQPPALPSQVKEPSSTEPQKPKLIIRRMAKPDQVDRMERIDAAKAASKKPE